MSRPVKIPDPLKAEIVTRFAFFESSKTVQAWLLEEHGLEVPFPQLAYYNCDNERSSRKLGQEWRAIFQEQRVRAISALERIGLSHETHRLRMANGAVDRIFRWADTLAAEGKLVDAVALLEKGRGFLEHAARERGGSFTNRHQVNGLVSFLQGLSPEEAGAMANLPPEELANMIPPELRK